jgi:hypothetical protein
VERRSSHGGDARRVHSPESGSTVVKTSRGGALFFSFLFSFVVPRSTSTTSDGDVLCPGRGSLIRGREVRYFPFPLLLLLGLGFGRRDELGSHFLFFLPEKSQDLHTSNGSDTNVSFTRSTRCRVCAGRERDTVSIYLLPSRRSPLH